MTSKVWTVGMISLGVIVACSSEKPGTGDPNVVDAASDAAGGADVGSGCALLASPLAHRSEAVTCPATASPDAAIVDQCLTDDQCATDTACACASEFHGNAIHTNQCVPAQCRVDSDCGAAGTCSPSSSGHCGSLTGLFCHTPADTCASNADCCGDSSRPLCGYQAELGHWACQAVIVCNG